MRHIHSLRVLMVTLGLCLLACDQGDVGSLTGDGGGTLPGTDSGFAPKPCVPTCTAPQVCSKTGECMNPGECRHDADCSAGLVCDPTPQRCVPPEQCGAQEIPVDAVAPHLLVVLDRSCSMTNKVGTTTKWQIAVAALGGLLAKYRGMIRFGLTLFPDTTGDKCTQDDIAVPAGSGNEDKIQNLLTAALAKADPNFPDGPCVTNIDTAMQQAATEPALANKSRPGFVLLITDGKQAGCTIGGGDAGTTKAIQELLKQGIPTFVVGFGTGVDPAQLNIFADAGGKPSGDPTTHFYKAEDQASLDQALASIAGRSFGCVLKLKEVPPTMDKIYVFVDGAEVAQDKGHATGWDYDPQTNQITFYGPICKSLEEGAVKDVDVVYGCKKPPGPGSCAPGVTPCSGPDGCTRPQVCVAGCCIGVIE